MCFEVVTAKESTAAHIAHKLSFSCVNLLVSHEVTLVVEPSPANITLPRLFSSVNTHVFHKANRFWKLLHTQRTFVVDKAMTVHIRQAEEGELTMKTGNRVEQALVLNTGLFVTELFQA